MYHRSLSHKRKSKRHGKKHHKTRGGSMLGRVAVPASLLVLQKMMHSRKRGKSIKRGRSMRRRGSRRR